VAGAQGEPEDNTDTDSRLLRALAELLNETAAQPESQAHGTNQHRESIEVHQTGPARPGAYPGTGDWATERIGNASDQRLAGRAPLQRRPAAVLPGAVGTGSDPSPPANWQFTIHNSRL